MTYIPPNQSFLDISQNSTDALYGNNRKLAIGKNIAGTDGGAGSTFTVEAMSAATITSVTTVSATSATSQFCNATSGAFALNLPAAAAATPKVFYIKKIDSSGNAVTVTPNGADTIEGASTKVLSAQYNWIAIQSDGTASWKIIGASSGASGAPTTDQYLLLSADLTNLPNSATFAHGNNIQHTGGTGGTYTLQVGTSSPLAGTTVLTGASNTTQWLNATAGAIVLTIPLASANPDKGFFFKKTDSSVNSITVTATSGDLIDGASTVVLSSQYDFVSLQANAASSTWNIQSTNYKGIAPLTGNYATVGSNGTLSNGRVITNGKNVTATDGGAGTTITFEENTYVAITSVTTLSATSATFVAASAAGGAYAINLPSASTSSPKKFIIKKTDSSANALTVTGNSSDTIDGSNTYVLSVQWQSISITSAGGTSWLIS